MDKLIFVLFNECLLHVSAPTVPSSRITPSLLKTICLL